MRCPKCYAPIEEEDLFCMACGCRISRPAANARRKSEDDTRNTASARGRYSRKPKKSRKPVWLGLAFVIVIFLVVFMIGSQDDVLPPVETTPETQGATLPGSSISESVEPSTEAVKQETESAQEDYISLARDIAYKEYEKYLQQEEANAFTQRAFANGITLDQLNRQPQYYEGQEVYFGGTVIQTIYDADYPSLVEMRIRVLGGSSGNDVIYVTYILQSGEVRVLEGDYVDMYGIAKGLVTYESVGSGNITIPYVECKYLYCYAVTEDSFTTPAMKELIARTEGNFIDQDGNTLSFSALEKLHGNTFSEAINYNGTIVAYFTPSPGWDEANPPPFYRVVAFEDGTLVIFEPSPEAEEGLYAIDDGTYTIYYPNGSESQEISNQETIGYVMDTSTGLNVRSGPAATYELVDFLEPLTPVTIFETQSDGEREWGRTEYGWVCMDYIAEGAPPENSIPSKVVNQFSGSWGDSVGYRCMMSVSFQNGNFVFDISWANGASSTNKWHFVGRYDATSKSVYYTNGTCSTLETDESGRESTTVHYTNGSGQFYISDGYMYWVDYVENAGSECVFEKIE